MKRWALYAGDAYYPLGGWNDFQGSYDTEQEALDEGAKTQGDWWHVIDYETGGGGALVVDAYRGARGGDWTVDGPPDG